MIVGLYPDMKDGLYNLSRSENQKSKKNLLTLNTTLKNYNEIIALVTRFNELYTQIISSSVTA